MTDAGATYSITEAGLSNVTDVGATYSITGPGAAEVTAGTGGAYSGLAR